MLGGPNGKGPLRKLSERTGGAMFEVSDKLSLDDIFARIEEELRSQYSIGYTPTEGAQPGEFREIRLRTKNKKLTEEEVTAIRLIRLSSDCDR